MINDTVQVTDAFLARFAVNGTYVLGTYIGGSDMDIPQSVTYYQGNIYLCGYTNNVSNLSTANSFQPVYGGGGFNY